MTKFSYAVQGLFQIIWGTSRGDYIVQKQSKPNSSELKFTSENLYILSSSLKLCELVNSSNIQYLNQPCAHIVDSLKTFLTLSYYYEKFKKNKTIAT